MPARGTREGDVIAALVFILFPLLPSSGSEDALHVPAK